MHDGGTLRCELLDEAMRFVRQGIFVTALPSFDAEGDLIVRLVFDHEPETSPQLVDADPKVRAGYHAGWAFGVRRRMGDPLPATEDYAMT